MCPVSLHSMVPIILSHTLKYMMRVARIASLAYSSRGFKVLPALLRSFDRCASSSLPAAIMASAPFLMGTAFLRMLHSCDRAASEEGQIRSAA